MYIFVVYIEATEKDINIHISKRKLQLLLLRPFNRNGAKQKASLIKSTKKELFFCVVVVVITNQCKRIISIANSACFFSTVFIVIIYTGI
jgi:hypothetical protein